MESRARRDSVELLDRGGRRRTLALQALRDLLGLCEDAQHVAARELLEVGVAPAAPRQLGEECRILRDVLEPDDGLGDAVEVAADADVIDARDLAHVLDRVRDVGDRRRRPRMRRAPGRDLGAHGRRCRQDADASRRP